MVFYCFMLVLYVRTNIKKCKTFKNQIKTRKTIKKNEKPMKNEKHKKKTSETAAQNECPFWELIGGMACLACVSLLPGTSNFADMHTTHFLGLGGKKVSVWLCIFIPRRVQPNQYFLTSEPQSVVCAIPSLSVTAAVFSIQYQHAVFSIQYSLVVVGVHSSWAHY